MIKKYSRQDDWEQNYTRGRMNRYPYDQVVSFVMRKFSISDSRVNVNILDLGCGGGNHVKFLSDEGFSAFGVDGSEAAIKSSMGFSGLQEGVSLFRANFSDLPFDDCFFDAVIDRQSIGHNNSKDIPLVVAEVARVLKPGGWIHSHFFHQDDPNFNFGEDNGKGDYTNFSGGAFTRSGLVHAFSVEQIHTFFSQFSIERLEKITTDDCLSKNTNSLVHKTLLMEARK